MRRQWFRIVVAIVTLFMIAACTKPEETLEKAMKEIEEKMVTTVDGNFSLPKLSKDFKDVKVSWTSDNTEIIANDGQFTQPILDTEVKINVVLTLKDKELKKEFIVTAVGKTESERAKLAKDELILTTDPVTDDLTLPKKNDTYGATITWVSSNEALISSDGKVKRSQDDDIEVKLTATIKVGQAQETKDFTVTVKKLAITDYEFTAPTKVVYIYGEELDLTGGHITLTYEDGSKSNVDLNSDMVSGYNAETLGEQTITVTYHDETFSFTVTVNDTIEQVILNQPEKLDYVYGDALDLTGGTLTVTYRSGDVKQVSLTSEMISGYHANQLGEQELTVTYETYELTFKVKVVDAISHYEFIKPTKERFLLGENLDLTGGKIKEVYKSGHVVEIHLELNMVSGYNKDQLGEQELTVNYNDESFTFTVVVIMEEISFTPPQKIEYIYGDSLDFTGGKLIVTNSLGEVEEVPLTAEMITGYNPSQLGEQTITVSYRGESFTFTVEVKDAIDTVTFQPPLKRNYLKDDAMDVTGGLFLVTYLSGKTEEIPLLINHIPEFDLTISGEQVIKVIYGEYEFEFTIVVAKEDAVKLPTPFGIVQDGRGIRWGRNEAIDEAIGFYVHINGMDEPLLLPVLFEISFHQLGLEPGDYEIRLQAVGDGIDFLNSDLTDPISITVPYDTGNLAQKGKASASSGNAQAAIDGNNGSRWESTHGIDDVHFTVDFGSIKRFQTIRIYWEGAYGKRYIIQVSNDGETWTDVYQEDNSDGGLDEIIFEEPIEARFVRLQGIERATPYGYSIWEFELYLHHTPNLARDEGVTVSASSGNASSVIDGNQNTRWESEHSDDQYLVIDLGQVKTFDAIVIKWETAYGKAYSIDVSEDGENWTTVYIEEQSNGAVDNIRFDAVQARYVKMQGIERATQWGYSIYEFEIYHIEE